MRMSMIIEFDQKIKFPQIIKLCSNIEHYYKKMFYFLFQTNDIYYDKFEALIIIPEVIYHRIKHT